MAATSFKILPDSEAEKTPSRLIPRACFTTDATDETTQSFYTADDGSVASGIWECPPCKLEIPSYPVNEMMTIVSGSLTITNADGIEETFGPGEVVFAAKGAKMTWHITERLRKYYMTSQ
ncbi:MAG: cupin domain-containing protein [Pseudomonadota bacterium]